MLTFIPPIAPIAGIVALIFIFLAIGDIKRINYQLNDKNLEMFHSKYIRSVILIIVGFILLVAGGVSLAFSILFPLQPLFLGISLFIISISLLVIGIVLLISSSVVEMKAWENLKRYFLENRGNFSNIIIQDVIEGCDNLRTGALLYALGFLLITLFIGFIFKIVGYFKLAKLNSIIYQQAPGPKESVVVSNAQKNERVLVSTVNYEISNYCPNCGAKLSNKEGIYCPLCGSKIN